MARSIKNKKRKSRSSVFHLAPERTPDPRPEKSRALGSSRQPTRARSRLANAKQTAATKKKNPHETCDRPPHRSGVVPRAPELSTTGGHPLRRHITHLPEPSRTPRHLSTTALSGSPHQLEKQSKRHPTKLSKPEGPKGELIDRSGGTPASTRIRA
jgi:hypothetical protein